MNYKNLQQQDKEVYDIIKKEETRQKNELEMIASENYVTQAVMEAMGSILTNKYSEGYPGSRYYGGNQIIDEIEILAIERAKKLFHAEHVNVQPLSGSPANASVYMAFLKPGDKVLGLKLDHGGHLSHGHSVNFSGILYNFADIAHTAGLIAGEQMDNPVPIFDVVSTTTHKTLRGPRGAIIMCKEKHAKKIDKAVFPGMQGGPHDHITAAKAVAFGEALKPEFKEYAKKIIINSKTLAEEFINRGYRIISDGTDNHLIVVDMTSKNTSGKETEKILERIGISVSRSTIPNDPNPPMNPSGVRFALIFF